MQPGANIFTKLLSKEKNEKFHDKLAVLILYNLTLYAHGRPMKGAILNFFDYDGHSV